MLISGEDKDNALGMGEKQLSSKSSKMFSQSEVRSSREIHHQTVQSGQTDEVISKLIAQHDFNLLD